MKIRFKIVSSIILLSLLCSCVNGNSPMKQSDEVKGMSNRLDVNHLKVEQTSELEQYASEVKVYLGQIQTDLTQLGHLLDLGDLYTAIAYNQSLINKGEQLELLQTPEVFKDLQDLHHSYYVALQELQEALDQQDTNDQQLHYGYSVLTMRLFSVEFQSLIEDFGIKSHE